MLPLIVRFHVAVLLAGETTQQHLNRLRAEEGQTSAEYALVLLGAATVAILIAVWAKDTEVVGNLLDTMFEKVGDLAG